METSSSTKSSDRRFCRSVLGEGGAAFAEFIITFPFLLIMLMGITDLGMALNAHLTLGRIAYEGARYASSIAQLEKVAANTNAEFIASPGHKRIKDRVELLLQRQNIKLSDLPEGFLRTERVRKEDIGTSADQVRVTLRVPFRTIFPFLQSVMPSLTADVTGPYLYVG